MRPAGKFGSADKMKLNRLNQSPPRRVANMSAFSRFPISSRHTQIQLDMVSRQADITADLQSSPPMPPSSQGRPKRAREGEVGSSPSGAGPSNLRSSPPPSSLPPSSPPAPFSDLDDEEDVGDDEELEMRQRGRDRDHGDDEDEDEEGEDLFNDNMLK